jgi:sorting and assembly machinery component 37
MWFALAFGGVACYVAQLWIRVTVASANRRPRRVQRRGAEQEHKAEVINEEDEGEGEEDEDEGVQDGDE